MSFIILFHWFFFRILYRASVYADTALHRNLNAKFN
jgi:hypothetical protein